jgi:hypothetical protein
LKLLIHKFKLFKMPFKKYADTIKFAQTATVTVADTTNETTLVGAGEGSLSVLKNSTLVGKTFKITGAGVYSNTGTPTLNLQVKLGAVAIAATGAVTTVTGASNRVFTFDILVTVRSVGGSGTAFAQGLLFENSTQKIWPMGNTSTVAVDTTANLAFNVTATWGTGSASNTISLTNLAIVEVN